MLTAFRAAGTDPLSLGIDVRLDGLDLFGKGAVGLHLLLHLLDGVEV